MESRTLLCKCNNGVQALATLFKFKALNGVPGGERYWRRFIPGTMRMCGEHVPATPAWSGERILLIFGPSRRARAAVPYGNMIEWLRSVIVILDADDIVLAEIAAGLHLDQLEVDLAGIFKAVLRAARHIDRIRSRAAFAPCRRWSRVQCRAPRPSVRPDGDAVALTKSGFSTNRSMANSPGRMGKPGRI